MVRLSYAANDAHLPLLYGSAAAICAAPGTDGWTDMASFQYAYRIHGLRNKNDEQTEMPTEPWQ